jgi:hypothetical protein
MTRLIRGQVLLASIALLATFTALYVSSAPIAAASTARSAKKSKKHKSKKKAVKKMKNERITAGTETLMFNAAVAGALEKAKVSTTATSPASGSLSSGFIFPLASGTLNPTTGLGSVTATGGITFASSFSVPGLFSSESNASVSEPALALNTAPTLSLTSQQATPPTFPFATVSLKGVHPASRAGAITLSDLPASLTATGAQFLNEFAAGSFTSGEAAGTLTVDVTASGG